jgi:hypothetical protein
MRLETGLARSPCSNGALCAHPPSLQVSNSTCICPLPTERGHLFALLVSDRSLRAELILPARLETGSMTAWGVGGSIPISPTIQSGQTADFQAALKEALSAGIFRQYRCGLSVSGDRRGLSGRFRPVVSASKNSVPGRRTRRPKPSGKGKP